MKDHEIGRVIECIQGNWPSARLGEGFAEEALIACGLTDLEHVLAAIRNLRHLEFAPTVGRIMTEIRKAQPSKTQTWKGTAEGKAAVAEGYKARELVPIKQNPGTLYLRQADCVELGGRWQKKIDFVIEKLGAEYVTTFLQQAAGKKEKQEILSHFGDPRNAKFYNRCLEMLVEKAKESA